MDAFELTFYWNFINQDVEMINTFQNEKEFYNTICKRYGIDKKQIVVRKVEVYVE